MYVRLGMGAATGHLSVRDRRQISCNGWSRDREPVAELRNDTFRFDLRVVGSGTGVCRHVRVLVRVLGRDGQRRGIEPAESTMEVVHADSVSITQREP